MVSPAQASVSLRPLPPIPTQAMFNLLLRFCPRKSAGTPKASAPAARELVLMNSRRSIREGTVFSGAFSESIFVMASTIIIAITYTRGWPSEQDSGCAALLDSPPLGLFQGKNEAEGACLVVQEKAPLKCFMRRRTTHRRR